MNTLNKIIKNLMIIDNSIKKKMKILIKMNFNVIKNH